MNQLSQCRRDRSSVKQIHEAAFPRGLRFVFGGLLFCTILIGSACEKGPVKPVSIKPNDICFYCKSPLDEQTLAFAAEFITKDGFVRKFDDIGCLVANARKVGRKNIQSFYAMDIVSKTLLPAEQLQFVRSDKIRTPKNGGTVAFQDASRAKEVASRFQTQVLTLDDILK